MLMKTSVIFRFLTATSFVYLALVPVAAQSDRERTEAANKRREVEAKVAESGSRTLTSLLPKEIFVSAEGGFSVELPSEADGVHELSQNGGLTTGKLFMWVLVEAGIVVGYSIFSDPKFEVETDQQIGDYLAGVRNGVLRGRKAELLKERPFTWAGHRGLEFLFKLPDGARGIGRAFLVGKRGYTLLAHLAEGSEAEELTLKAFDSFQLLPDKTK